MALENITYKSYCWSLGTTSFRTKNFSQKIERQLEILAEFWEKEENQRESWNKNDGLQSRYYDFMKEKGFITGEAPNKPKDAREKTSGLADIGLISEDRRLTEVGQALLKLSKKGDFTSDNVLQIPKDSYIYFKQLLKTSCNLDGRFVRPFLVLAFLLDRLGSLDMEEYTYLLPLCIDRKTIEETAEYIEARRKGGGSVYDGTTPWYAGMDGFILHILLEKENYKKAQELFLSAPVDKELFRAAGMNRKSRAYDEKYLPLYQMTEEVCRKGNTKYAGELYRATKGFQAKIGSQWRQIFFNTTSVKAIEKDPASHLKENFFQKVSGDGEFKTLFFQTMHLIKVKANLSDYQDLNKRYIKNTDLVLFEDGEVKFDIVPRHFFRKRMEELFALAFEESGNLLFNCPVEEIAPCLEAEESEIIEGINQELGTSVKSMDEARDILERERYRRLDRLIDSRFDDKSLVRLLELFEKRNDDEITAYVTDNADIPTIFEYVLGIIWYKVSERKGRILDYMKLSLEADLLPKTHAAGGEADIVYEYPAREGVYPAHTLLLEATLANDSSQRNMEMEPVSRHLGNCLLKTGNPFSYCIFTSSRLNINVMADFRCRKYMQYFDTSDTSRFVEGMKIIPVGTGELKKIILSKRTYKELYPVFEAAYRSEKKLPEWYEEEIAARIS